MATCENVSLDYHLSNRILHWRLKNNLWSGRLGVRNLPPPWCVLEQDTLLPENTGYTQKAVAWPDMTEKLLTGT